jgi:hypothetical protein
MLRPRVISALVAVRAVGAHRSRPRSSRSTLPVMPGSRTTTSDQTHDSPRAESTKAAALRRRGAPGGRTRAVTVSPGCCTPLLYRVSFVAPGCRLTAPEAADPFWRNVGLTCEVRHRQLCWLRCDSAYIPDHACCPVVAES